MNRGIPPIYKINARYYLAFILFCAGRGLGIDKNRLFSKSASAISLFLFCFLAVFSLTGCIAAQKKTDIRYNTNNSPQKKIETEHYFKADNKVGPDHLKLAVNLIKQGFYEVAFTQLEEAEKKNPDKAKIFHLMGKCKLEINNYKEAEKYYTKAIGLQPDYAPAYNGLGLVHDLTGQKETAWKYYKKAISINPARADYYNNLGFSEIMGNKYKDAIKHLSNSIALNPKNKKAINNLALCHITMGDEKKALELLKKTYPPDVAKNNMKAINRLHIKMINFK